MDKPIHKKLASGKWNDMSLAQQLGNIGSEVNRSIVSFNKGDNERFQSAFERTLELFDLTINDERWKSRLKEINRSREVFCSLFFNQDEFKNLKKEMDSFNEYFLQFGMLARNKKGAV